MSKSVEDLEKLILSLREELASREQDIESYKTAFIDLNQRMQTLVGHIAQNLESMKFLQKALVPTQIPSIPGFEFSTKFNSGTRPGGDYFDVFGLGDKSRFGIVVGTSSDYTTSALLLATLLGVSSKANYLLEPGRLIENIGRELSPQFNESVDVDMFYSCFDRRNYLLSYCCLGNIRVFHQDYESGKVQLLKGNKNSLTQGFEDYPETEELELGPRDRLVVCTRGLFMEQGPTGEEYGVERLVESIMEAPRRGAHELRNHLLLKYTHFVDKEIFNFDRTVVIAEVMDKVIKLA